MSQGIINFGLNSIQPTSELDLAVNEKQFYLFNTITSLSSIKTEKLWSAGIEKLIFSLKNNGRCVLTHNLNLFIFACQPFFFFLLIFFFFCMKIIFFFLLCNLFFVVVPHFGIEQIRLLISNEFIRIDSANEIPFTRFIYYVKLFFLLLFIILCKQTIIPLSIDVYTHSQNRPTAKRCEQIYNHGCDEKKKYSNLT